MSQKPVPNCVKSIYMRQLPWQVLEFYFLAVFATTYTNSNICISVTAYCLSSIQISLDVVFVGSLAICQSIVDHHINKKVIILSVHYFVISYVHFKELSIAILKIQ